MPRINDLKLSGPRVLIVIRPDGKIPPEELGRFFNFQQEKNNLLVISGRDSYLADAVEERLRELYAIEQICKNLKDGDNLFEDARSRKEDFEQRFNKALSAAYDRLYYPGIHEDGSENLLMSTIDNGLNMGSGENSAERQIEQLLASPRANYKLALDFQEELTMYWAMAESELWPDRERRTPWKDVVMRAKTNLSWPWIPGNSGLDTLKSEALKQGRWRCGADGYIEKGPFEKEKTSVNVLTQRTNHETGESILTLIPHNCGASPVVHFSSSISVSVKDPKIEDCENFSTNAATLYFLAIDSDGQHETGEPQRWIADLKIRHQIKQLVDKRLIELRCVPESEMTYTLDGSNPKDGIIYDEPFEISSTNQRLLVYARSGDAIKSVDFQIPSAGDKKTQINDSKPAKITEDKRMTLDNIEAVFKVINRFKDNNTAKFKGVRIHIGEGENTVMIRFGEREISAGMIGESINSFRQILSENQSIISVTVNGGVTFESGFDAKEFSKLSGIEFRPGDIVQED